MNVEQMRAALIKAYPNSKTWKPKVLKMPEDQVFAVYSSMKRQGKI
jgi:hypothetical protein